MSKKEGKPITKAKKSTLATTKKKARVLPNKKEGKPDITATQSLWEVMNIEDTKLSVKQMMFVLEYCVDLNATRAYKEVYKVSQEIAETAGPRLLGNVRVKEAIAKYMLPKVESLWLWAERRLKTLQSIVNKCMQLEPITQIIRYEKITTTTNEKWNEETTRDTQYREEEVKGPFNPGSAISAVDSITNLFKVEAPKDKEMPALSDKQKQAILALGSAFKPPVQE